MTHAADAIFGSTFACECGKTHRIAPNEVIYETGALARVPEVCGRTTAGRFAAVFMDRRTREAAGREVCRALSEAGWRLAETVVPDPTPDGSPVCDDVTKEKLNAFIPSVDLLVSVGSGVINDLGKWIAFERDVPFVVVGTAASMNGYASANVAPTLAGVKTLVRARPPAAVVADPRVIRAAPWKMTASGLGDILAKSVSSTDWKMNRLLFGDYYCERSVNLIVDIEPLYFEHPEALAARDPQAIGALFQGLLLTGVAMTMAETSAPSSGGEHMIGHTLDMMSSVDGAPHDLHGRQVGVGTILASEVYRRVMALESPALGPCATEIDAKFWGPLAGVVQEHYSGKIERLNLAREKLRNAAAWDDLRSHLAPMLRTPEAVKDCLAAAGAAHRAGDIGCDRARLLAAFLHAHEIRSRFTILDLAHLVGMLPEAAGEIVDTYTM